MNDYWGVPEEEYEISLMQFARQQLSDSGYSVLEEKVEVCSGAGALTLTAIIKKGRELMGLYIHDGPRQRKQRGSPIIRVLGLLPEIKNVENLRKFVIMHQDGFYIILEHENTILRDKAQVDLLQIYSNLYDSKIRDLYETDLSSAADVLRVRLRKESQA
ncbi:MAG TPA: hypothetical protein VKL21_07160 [Candidatus Methanoperedens sp.]|nr:hypothetical protein [Candidatus Methanoperedens sp.]